MPEERNGNDKMEEAILSPRERQVMLEEIGLVGLTLGKALLADSESNETNKKNAKNAKSVSTSDEAITLAASPATAQTATPLERLHLLEALWPEIEAALRRLSQPPRSTPALRSVRTPLQRSLGGSAAAAAVARNPQIAAVWRHEMRSSLQHDSVGSEGEFAAQEQGSLYVHERRPQTCERLPLNRFIVMLLIELEREAQHLAELSAFCADADSRHRAERIGRSVTHWRTLPPFAALSSLTGLEWAALRRTAALAQWEPAARSLYACWVTLHHPLHFDWSRSPLLWLPALEAWHLYEIWCFMKVAACLFEAGWQPTDAARSGRSQLTTPATKSSENSCLVRCTPDGLRLHLATGRASTLHFRTPIATDSAGRRSLLTLTYQPFYPSANQQQMSRRRGHQIDPSPPDPLPPACYSLSHAMQPDIALQRRNQIYLLDAKYRRYGPHKQAGSDTGYGYNALLDDVDKMHTYRDSIVCNGRRAIRQAWCLFPGNSSTIPEIIAYPAGTPEHPFGTAGVGAVSLRPGQPPHTLDRLLTEWLSGSLS